MARRRYHCYPVDTGALFCAVSVGLGASVDVRPILVYPVDRANSIGVGID